MGTQRFLTQGGLAGPWLRWPQEVRCGHHFDQSISSSHLSVPKMSIPKIYTSANHHGFFGINQFEEEEKMYFEQLESIGTGVIMF